MLVATPNQNLEAVMNKARVERESAAVVHRETVAEFDAVRVALHQKKGDREATKRTRMRREIGARKADVRVLQNRECHWLSKLKDLPKALSLMNDSHKEESDAVALPLTVRDFQTSFRKPVALPRSAYPDIQTPNDQAIRNKNLFFKHSLLRKT
jgi:hypothetical protein